MTKQKEIQEDRGMKPYYHIGGFYKEPTTEHECLEAIWSQGGACCDCKADCYRAGYSKVMASADNKRLVSNKITGR